MTLEVPEATESNRRRETLTIVTPRSLASKGVIKSRTKWYLDRRGRGFAQSLTIAIRRRISWTNKLRRRNKGLVQSETKRISFVFEKKAYGKLLFSIVIKYVYRVFVSLLYPGRSSPVWPCPKRDLKLIFVTYRLSLNYSMVLAIIDRERSTIRLISGWGNWMSRTRDNRLRGAHAHVTDSWQSSAKCYFPLSCSIFSIRENRALWF